MSYVNLDQDSTQQSRPARKKNLEEVTLADVANLDSLAICCDEPVRQVPDTSRLQNILDITSFKPFKPLSRREERAAKAKEPPVPKPPSRKLPFGSRKKVVSDFPRGETMSLQQHDISDLERDYYQSLLDLNGKFQKYAPKMVCHTDVLAVEFRLQIAEGKIWRAFLMEAGTNFYLLRRAILDLMGWSEEVSWSFMYISRENKVCMVGQSGPLKTDAEIRNEEQMVIVETLHENYCKFCFLYDLQVRWRVDLFLSKVLDREENGRYPICVRGKGLLNFPRIRDPGRLSKVCKVLKDPEHAKRGKYVEKYGDLLIAVPVTATPFPSFYEQPQVVEAPPPLKKRKKTVEEGPIIVTISTGELTQSSDAYPIV